MKRSDLAINFIILIIIGIIALIFVIIFLFHGSFPIINSQQNLTNVSNTQLNNTLNNITSLT